MSFANFPIIWLFGMRNNVVIWLTGWHFGTYNNFHRWVARVATFQAVVHSIGYTILILRSQSQTETLCFSTTNVPLRGWNRLLLADVQNVVLVDWGAGQLSDHRPLYLDADLDTGHHLHELANWLLNSLDKTQTIRDLPYCSYCVLCPGSPHNARVG